MKFFGIELSLLDLIILGWLGKFIWEEVLPMIFNKKNKNWVINKAWPKFKSFIFEEENTLKDKTEKQINNKK